MADKFDKYKNDINSLFCDYNKKQINKPDALNLLSNISLEIKNNPLKKKRELKNDIFQIKKFINK